MKIEVSEDYDSGWRMAWQMAGSYVKVCLEGARRDPAKSGVEALEVLQAVMQEAHDAIVGARVIKRETK